MAGKKPGPNAGQGEAYKWLLANVQHKDHRCLRWPFSYDERVGRGRCGFNGKGYWAHRLMCEMAHGPAPEGKNQVAHSCGNGHMGCVNPLHLSWSNNKENSQDKIRHGTTRKAGGRKLPREAMERIRALKGQQTQMETARQFGVSLSCVQYHQHGKERWPSHSQRKQQINERGGIAEEMADCYQTGRSSSQDKQP